MNKKTVSYSVIGWFGSSTGSQWGPFEDRAEAERCCANLAARSDCTGGAKIVEEEEE